MGTQQPPIDSNVACWHAHAQTPDWHMHRQATHMLQDCLLDPARAGDGAGQRLTILRHVIVHCGTVCAVQSHADKGALAHAHRSRTAGRPVRRGASAPPQRSGASGAAGRRASRGAGQDAACEAHGRPRPAPGAASTAREMGAGQRHGTRLTYCRLSD